MASKRMNKQKRKHKYQNGVYEEEFIVERIVDKTLKSGSPFYKVKWHGYPASECTWEPLEHLTNVQDLVADFELSQANAPNKAGSSESIPPSSAKNPSRIIALPFFYLLFY